MGSFDFSSQAGPLDKRYGFKRKDNRFKQLKRVLKLETRDAEFEIIKAELEALTRKYVDVDGPAAHHQAEAMDLIEKELLRIRPSFWGGEGSLKKLYFALRTVMVIHLADKKKKSLVAQSGCTPSKKKDRASPPMIDLTLDSSGHESEASAPRYAKKKHKFRPKSPLRDDRHRITSSPQASSRTRSALLVSPKKRPMSREIKKDSSSSSGSESDPAPRRPLPKKVRRGSLPLRTQARPQNAVVKVQEDAVDLNSYKKESGSGILFLHNFLSTCKPSMKHYLHLFVDFGSHANWEVNLRAFAKDWTPEDRQDLLRQILAGEQKNLPVMAIDIAVLENHFKTFFN